MATTVKPQKRADIQAAMALAAAGDTSVAANVSVWLDGDFLREMPTVVGELVLAQRLLRRLSTPRGLFPWWPNDGLNCAKYLLSKTAPWIMKSEIEAECLRDEQVQEVTATPTIVKTAAGDLVQISLFVVTSSGAFDFVMNITQASATLIKVQSALS